MTFRISIRRNDDGTHVHGCTVRVPTRDARRALDIADRCAWRPWSRLPDTALVTATLRVTNLDRPFDSATTFRPLGVT